MPAPDSSHLVNLLLVAGHAVYVGQDFLDPEQHRHWFLQSFQRGEPPFYIEHIRAGIDVASRDPSSLLVFSGGQTRGEAGPRSEAQSYWNLAEHFRWWSTPEISGRTTTEEFARDSFEVVSWAFKERWFALHREALRFPDSRFEFHGANQPDDLVGAKKGEAKAIAAFEKDPYGAGDDLGKKRADRNPFCRISPYPGSCSELVGILHHRGPSLYEGKLPWL